MRCALCGEWQDMNETHTVERLGATTIHVCRKQRLCLIRTLSIAPDTYVADMYAAALALIPKDT